MGEKQSEHEQRSQRLAEPMRQVANKTQFPYPRKGTGFGTQDERGSSDVVEGLVTVAIPKEGPICKTKPREPSDSLEALCLHF